eukprot:CAMPEP_0201281240 /NCGR_PEP_ID=MMETSP1317-20130820/2010_1 /ASSEMBLY_ACC=CAM_ASM_000770 /TAXON_ID=187299 /ORGANISM="Undescribed Undescribed, Strain Undescribed" /LENGTH=69 /DNA_ID=CAMNT_0047590561 /DNA_START=2397 /DNA_END=2603 /DNA_ORIENTATION=+
MIFNLDRILDNAVPPRRNNDHIQGLFPRDYIFMFLHYKYLGPHFDPGNIGVGVLYVDVLVRRNADYSTL